MNGKSDFERDLNEYLNERKKSRFFHNMLKSFKNSEKVKLNPELETYEVPAVQTQQAIHQQSNGVEKKGFFSWLLGSKSEEESVSKEVVENISIREDLKIVAKVAISILKKLPPQELLVFKNSDDYAMLKDTLKKHNLIK